MFKKLKNKEKLLDNSVYFIKLLVSLQKNIKNLVNNNKLLSFMNSIRKFNKNNQN